MRPMSPQTMEIMSALEDVFVNPFPNESKKWHKHQRLIRTAAEKICSFNYRMSMVIERPKILGILHELERDVSKIAPKKPETAAT